MSLQRPAGVELQFAEFVATAARRFPEWFQHWMNPERSIDPSVAALLGEGLASTFDSKYRGEVKLPSVPRSIRAWHCRRALARAGTDIVLIWNRTARSQFVLDAIGPSRCIHFEHGAAWFSGRERERRAYLSSVPAAITNSRASARILELMWGYAGTIRVCRNALRPSLVPPGAPAKRLPSDRPLRLGVAARLFPVKGVAVALHALAALRRRSLEAELHIAGTGPEQERLSALAARLGLTQSVRFRGGLRDMPAFYAEIDCLVHTPFSEAFGLVAIEAAAHGCPVIAPRVDGLPEAVEDGVSGRCLTPTLSLADYADLGGSVEGLPERIYDPDADALAEPRALAPEHLADAVETLFASREVFEQASRTASRHVVATFDFERHVDELMSAVATIASSRATTAA